MLSRLGLVILRMVRAHKFPQDQPARQVLVLYLIRKAQRQSVSHGPYLFRLDGWNVGNVLSGRFATLRDGEELKGGYFVGGLEAMQTTNEANR